MDITDLQTRLAQLDHLLPSQREWLERLLFQLAFNDHQLISILGSAGSGKSTLALAIAELLSDQYNIALLDTSVSKTAATQQLMQQWFGQPGDPSISITEQIAITEEQAPLAVVIDDAERFSSEFIRQLSSLPSLVFCFSTESSDEAGLTLTLNRVTTDDAEQLLRHDALNSIEIAERLASSNGNMHRLLQPVGPDNRAETAEVVAEKSAELKKRGIWAALAAVFLITLLYVFWPSQKQPELSVRIPVEPAQTPVLPVEVPAAGASVEDTAIDSAINPGSDQIEAEVSAEAVTDTEPGSEAETVALPEPVADSTESQTAGTEIASEETVSSPAVPDTADSDSTVFGYDEVKLLSLQKSQVAVQLAVLSSDAALARFKRAYPALDTLSYQRSWQGKMQLVLLLAPFDNASDAKATMAALPAALRASGPFTKAIKTIHSEISARQVSLQSGQQD
mgnify:FL=1